MRIKVAEHKEKFDARCDVVHANPHDLLPSVRGKVGSTHLIIPSEIANRGVQDMSGINDVVVNNLMSVRGYDGHPTFGPIVLSRDSTSVKHICGR